MFNVNQVRKDFPILHQKINNKDLIYLDNAATTQKPFCVLESLQHYYESQNANVHRAVYSLSERATLAYENARDTVQNFIHAAHREEIIWVKGTTEAINLVAQSFLRPRVKAGDEILISALEHHANIVPWQLVAEQTGAVLKVAPINEKGELIWEKFIELLSPKIKLCAVSYVSNAIGIINPIKKIIEACHAENIPVLVDAAQAAPHIPLNVEELNCDFLAFSSHKCYGPTGIGVLYGKKALLEAMPPYQGGGDMIYTVSFSHSTYAPLPLKFEAGTPNIADAIAFAAALNYLSCLNWDEVQQYEALLYQKAVTALSSIAGLHIIGEAPVERHAPLISFVMDHIHPHDMGTILNEQGVCVRTGHHCAMPLMNFFNLAATTRASFSFYNTEAEIIALVNAIKMAKKLFSV